MNWSDVIAALAWSLAGFVVGFLGGRISRDVRDIRNAAVDDDEYTGPDRRRRRPPFGGDRLLGVFLILLAISTVTLLAVSNAQQRAIVDCQADVNRQLVEAINARGDSAAKDRKALNDMLQAVLTLPTPEQRRDALVDYLNTSKRTDEERARAPYPDPEDFDCKEAR